MYYKLFLNPISLYFILWIFFTVGNMFGIMNYPPKVNNFYFVLAISFISALSGASLAKIIFSNRKINYIKKERNIVFLYHNIILLKKLNFYFSFVAFVGILLIYIQLFSQISLSYFLENQASVKVEVDRSVLGGHLIAFAYVSLLIGVIIYKFTTNYKYVVIPFILIFMYSMSFFGRLQIFVALIMWYFMYSIMDYLLMKKKKLKKTIIILLLSSLMAFSFLAHTIELRISEYGINYDPYRDYVSSETKDFFQTYSFLFASDRASTLTYAYLFNPIATLNYWVEYADQLEFGRNSFPYFYRLMLKVGFVTAKDDFIGNDESVGEMGLQLPTYLGALYKDFEFIGIIFFPFLLLFMSNFLYNKLNIYGDIVGILLLPIILTFIVFSPLIFFFKDITHFDFLVITFFTGLYLKKKFRAEQHNAI